MDFSKRAFAALLLSMSYGVNARAEVPDCASHAVHTHVWRLISIYGPMSLDHEFFGFIYLDAGRIDSAVVRSRPCVEGNCIAEVTVAGQRIPAGAQVLGEWHTHPRDGSMLLSKYDVHGAWRNRDVPCYTAFYGRPDGQILAWDPRSTSVPTAMASSQKIGAVSRYRG